MVESAIAESLAAIEPPTSVVAPATTVAQTSPVTQAQEAAQALLRQLEDDEQAFSLIMELVS